MMPEFIASRIILETEKNIEAGQEKYRAYFTRHNIYAKWKPEVDAILEVEGYGDAIVTR